MQQLGALTWCLSLSLQQMLGVKHACLAHGVLAAPAYHVIACAVAGIGMCALHFQQSGASLLRQDAMC